jgi:predicted outer membrane lipoprotein
MKLEPEILRHGHEAAALGAAAVTEILIGMAVIAALCTAMAAVQELRRGIIAAVGWLALALVGVVLAAAFAVHAAMPAVH